jgi:indolepyruvate ferredoxin oxidoreductase
MSDEPEKYPASPTSPPASRSATATAGRTQRELRDTPGVTALVYDQTCAAEKRRRRKRGSLPRPAGARLHQRAVCEGCGDCAPSPTASPWCRWRPSSAASAPSTSRLQQGLLLPRRLLPEHRHGAWRQRAARPGAGGRRPRRRRPARAGAARLADPYGILVAGVGGTGVVTIGALLGMAAHLDGKGVTVLDMTGLAQKGGAVMSHVRLAERQEQLHSRAHRHRRGRHCCSAATSSSPSARTPWSKTTAGRTQAIVNTGRSHHRRIPAQPDREFPARRHGTAVATRSAARRPSSTPARLATR